MSTKEKKKKNQKFSNQRNAGRGGREGGILTQSFLQRLDVAALGTALPPLLVIGTVVSESRAGAAAGPDTVALELAFPADHAGEALGLGDAGVVWVRVARRGAVVVRAVPVAAVARRAVVRGVGHGEGLVKVWRRSGDVGDGAGGAADGWFVVAGSP